MDFKQLQAEHVEWLAREYPGQRAELPAAGMIEEAAELLHAVLKLKQVDIWGEESRYPASLLTAKLRDAIGDCAIYCCSYCNSAKLDFATVANSKLTIPPPHTLFHLAQKLISLSSTPPLYMACLRTIAEIANVPLEATVSEVWAEVKLRTRKGVPCNTIAK